VSLYASDGTTQGFFWDASTQRLGLGTTTPDRLLDIESNVPVIRLTDTTTSGLYHEILGDGDSLSIEADDGNVGSSSSVNFKVGGTQRMTIDSVGNVGIGTASVDEKLDVNGNVKFTGTGRIIKFDKNGSGEDNAIYYDNSTASNNLFIGRDSSNLAFRTSGSEAMRIDSSGNVLVGRTSVGTTGTGHSIRGADSAVFVRSGGESIIAARNTSDGQIIRFDKDGTTVGSIASRAGVVTSVILNPASGTGAGISGGTSAVVPADESTIRDNEISLGVSTHRFKDLYLSGGVYLGGTGSANYLDDYEEGTWTCTPSDSSGNNSSTTATGAYTKIGDVVNVRLNTIQNISTSGLTGSDTLRLNGLPFSVSGNTAGSSSANRIAYASGRTSMTVRAKNGTSYLELIQDGNDANTALATVSNVVSGTSDIAMISITYKTNE
jgi:hypothetical protein